MKYRLNVRRARILLPSQLKWGQKRRFVCGCFFETLMHKNTELLLMCCTYINSSEDSFQEMPGLKGRSHRMPPGLDPGAPAGDGARGGLPRPPVRPQPAGAGPQSQGTRCKCEIGEEMGSGVFATPSNPIRFDVCRAESSGVFGWAMPWDNSGMFFEKYYFYCALFSIVYYYPRSQFVLGEFQADLLAIESVLWHLVSQGTTH